MLEILLATIPALLPQDPPTAPPQTGTNSASAQSRSAQWLPDTTLAALLIEPASDDSEFEDFLATPEFKALAQQVGTLLQPLLPITGDELASVVRGGCALGFVGFTAGQLPDVVLTTHLGTATNALRERLQGLPRNGELYVVPGPLSLFLGIREGEAAIGTDVNTVQTTLARAIDGASASLATSQDFVQARASTARPIAQVFVRVGDLATTLVGHVPQAAATTARRVVDVLGLDAIEWVSSTAAIDGKDLVSRMEVHAPKIEGLLDALGGQPGHLDASLARFVPAGASGYGFFTVQFGTVFDELLALAAAVQPVAGKAMAQQLDQMTARTGVDIRATIVGGLAGRVIAFATGDTPGYGLLCELRQGPAFERALTKLLATVPTPLQAGTSLGANCWRAPQTSNGMRPSFAIVGSWLAICSDDSVLSTAVRQLQQPRADQDVTDFLRSLPKDATGAMLTSAAAMPGGGAPAATSADDMRHFVVRRTDSGFLSEDRVATSTFARTTANSLAMITGPASATPTAVATATDEHEDPQAAAKLRDCESEGRSRANVTMLAALLSHKDPAIVARACWLLGEWQAADSIVVLGDVAHEHADANVRLQATAALQRIGGTATAQALAQVTLDADPRVRTIAIQALGRLGAQLATTPVLAMMDHFGSIQAPGTPDDLIAALVVLHDLGDAANLLPAATAIGYSQPQLGQALAFLFQGLSPHLQPKDEVATLLAVLDHKEPLLRRYAIQRLGELRDASTASALERRLAAESTDLQPLIRVSLAQVRGDVSHDDDDLVARAKSNVAAISQMVERRWNTLGSTGKIATGATVGTLLLVALGFVIVRRRARRYADVAAAQSLVEPSAGYAASGRGQRFEPDTSTTEEVGSGRHGSH